MPAEYALVHAGRLVPAFVVHCYACTNRAVAPVESAAVASEYFRRQGWQYDAGGAWFCSGGDCSTVKLPRVPGLPFSPGLLNQAVGELSTGRGAFIFNGRDGFRGLIGFVSYGYQCRFEVAYSAAWSWLELYAEQEGW